MDTIALNKTKESKAGLISLLILSVLFIGEQYLNAFPLFIFPVRIYVVVLVAGILVVFFGTVRFKIPSRTRVMALMYLLFLVYYYLISLANGDHKSINYLKLFSSRYLIVFIIIICLPLLLKRKPNLNSFLPIFLFLGILNAMFVIFQSQGIDFFWNIADTLNPDIIYIGDGKYYFKEVTKYPTAAPVGLKGFVVLTGYFLVATIPLCFAYLNKSRALTIALLSLVVFSVLLTQQRSALLLSIPSTLYIGYLASNKKRIYLTVLFILLVTIFLFGTFFLGQLLDLVGSGSKVAKFGEDVIRVYYFEKSIEFIMANPFLGGMQLYFSETPPLYSGVPVYTPHNLFLNALMMGGVGLFVIVLSLVFYTFRTTWRSIRSYRSMPTRQNFLSMLFFMSSCLIIMNSQFHNAGFTSADSTFWWYFIIGDILKSYE